MENRIAEIENRIQNVEKELAELKAALNIVKHAPTEHEKTQQAFQSNYNAFHDSNVYAFHDNNVSNLSHSVYIQPDEQLNLTPQVLPHAYAPRFSNKPKKDLEKAIGKSFMGIFASVLIFISLILFATLVYPFLGTKIKILCIYAISFTFITVGLVKLQKNKSSKLFISITGCGIGALYICILLTNIYFKLIGDIVLYTFILLWSVLVCILSKLNSKIFLIIGQLGIFISMYFGHNLCVEHRDASKYFILAVFFIISYCIFFFSHLNKSHKDNIVNNIFFTLNALTYTFSISIFHSLLSRNGAVIPDMLKSTSLLIAIFMLGYILFDIFWTSKTENKSDTDFAVFTTLNLISFYIMLYQCTRTLGGTDAFAYAVVIPFVIGTMAYTYYYYGNLLTVANMTLTIFSAITLSICTVNIDRIYKYCHLFIWAIPIFILGFKKDNKIYKGIALAFYLFSATPVINPISFPRLIGAIITFALVILLLTKYREQYSSFIKCFSYMVFLFITAISFDAIPYLSDLLTGRWNETLAFITICTLNMFAAKSVFRLNFKTNTEDTATVIVTNITNAMLMLATFPRLTSYDNEIQHMLVICFAIAIYLLNSGGLIRKYNKPVADIYVGAKLTVLVSAIFRSFHAQNYILSIVCFLLAIISILIGFIIKRKPLRIYGLALSIFSVVKLIMLDIHYDNTIGHAVSFFICGILCFVINIIYNIIDRKMSE